ncbi:hypothetical protein FA95DRAFT_1566818 [Auriscalpium vulgare]|uniref:Uncharacterized protein n=1 Tax=Auriscalpium vulgare TaxID=40419 RepID=A0ACB8R855_9AGAM|nr:hypothetical protein FA95DRAFT_1566818 [Auriscalpium vulgare]
MLIACRARGSDHSPVLPGQGEAGPYGVCAVKMQPIVRRHLDEALQSFQVARSEGGK